MPYDSEFGSTIEVVDSVSMLDMVLQFKSTVQAKVINLEGKSGAHKYPGLGDSTSHILAKSDFLEAIAYSRVASVRIYRFLLAEYYLIVDM